MSQRHGSTQAAFRNRFAFLGQPCCSLHNVPAATVVETDIEHQTVITCCQSLCLRKTIAHFFREIGALSHKTQLHAFCVQAGHFLGQCTRQQIHQSTDFILRTIPVLRRKCKHRQHTHAALNAQAHAATQSFQALLMPRQTGHKTFFGPAPIAIHHDGNMRRHHSHLRSHKPRSASLTDYTARMSFSFSDTSTSISAMNLSVSFWMSASERF